ncbi:hypothetical protein ACI65C_008450 [Semiaphis heraclei]
MASLHEATWVKLVDIDFQCLYKEASNMLNMFDNSKINLIKVIDQRLKDAANKKIYNDMIENRQITESSKSCIIMYLLHAILIPTNKKSTTNSQGKKTIIKYSIQDSQNSSMMVAPTAVEIEEIFKRKYNVGDAIQPCILIVGTVTEPIEILVFFDGINFLVLWYLYDINKGSGKLYKWVFMDWHIP